MDVQLVSSPDGWTWRRELNRRPVLPLGQRGRFDGGMVMAAAGPIPWRGTVLLVYDGLPTCHDGAARDPDDGPPGPGGIGVAEYEDGLLRP
jgi:hypothetical protein